MYVPDHFRLAGAAEAAGLMRSRPFAVLVSAGGGTAPVATHLPTVLKDEGPHGTIECHLARANPHWRALRALGAGEALVIYAGDQAYIRPGWYPSKAAHGKVVPTWNYTVVHAYGVPEVIEDGAWLARHVGELTNQQERARDRPWSTSDAPESFIATMTRGIVGVRIPITRLEAKAKLGQNRERADALGAADGLAGESGAEARAVGAAMRRHLG
jgi:transcriptional regulator